VALGNEVDRRRTVSRLALATAVVGGLGVVSVIIFFAVGGPFGFINDIANALLGLLSLALAWHWSTNRRGGWSTLAIAAAALGAIVMVIGSLLIIFDMTGWYLAALISSTGSALIGIWLLVANRLHRHSAELPRGLIMLGITAAIFLIIGWLALPGVLARIDDPQLAPLYVNAGLINWTGTYLLYPIWCLWLSRRHGG
jgi:energy-converting hydrogenase Eha subunit A